MNDRLQDNLARARDDLLEARECLRMARVFNLPGLGDWEWNFCKCLDRAWDAQCMANPGLQ